MSLGRLVVGVAKELLLVTSFWMRFLQLGNLKQKDIYVNGHLNLCCIQFDENKSNLCILLEPVRAVRIIGKAQWVHPVGDMLLKLH